MSFEENLRKLIARCATPAGAAEVIFETWYMAEWINMLTARPFNPPPTPLYLGIPLGIVRARGSLQ